MEETYVKYGLHNSTPDLLESLPSMGKLKKRNPSYIKRAEDAQIMARRFARTEMLPGVLKTDKKCSKDPTWFDWELWRKANHAKLNISPIPEKLGGLGWSALANAVMVEEMASVCLAGTSNITFNTFGLLGALVECRTGIILKIIRMMVDAQKNEKPLFWSWAITEPGAGTDMEEASGMKKMRPSTRADKVPGGYRINGTKCFITNGSVADILIAYAYSDVDKRAKGVTAFVIEKGSQGLAYGKNENKMGMRGSINSELFFEDLKVPVENRIGEEGDGFKNMMAVLNSSRVFSASQAVGLAQGAIDEAVNYANQRIQFGAPISKLQAIQFMMADMVAQTEAARLLTYQAATYLDKNNKNQIPKFCSMAKFIASDTAMKVTTDAVQVMGGYGYMKEFPVERMMRDAKLIQIYTGTNQVMRLVAAREIFERKGNR